MNQNSDNGTHYDALREDPIHEQFRKLNEENKLKAIRFVESLKATQYTPAP